MITFCQKYSFCCGWNSLWGRYVNVRTFWEKEVVRVEVDGAALPSDLVGVTHAPAQRVEHGHDDAAGKDDDPAEQQQVCDANEDDTS